MIRRIQAATAERDKGFTLIELLVVIVIIGILAAIAIPAFLGQRQQGYDASVKNDLKAYAIAAETTFASTLRYPDATVGATGFATNGAATPIKSPNTSYTAFTDPEGPDAGYVIYGKHDDSDTYFVLSSYDGGAPKLAADQSAIPASPDAADWNDASLTPTFGTAITW